MEITEFSIANPSVHVGYDDSHSYRMDLSLSVSGAISFTFRSLQWAMPQG